VQGIDANCFFEGLPMVTDTLLVTLMPMGKDIELRAGFCCEKITWLTLQRVFVLLISFD